MIAALSLDKGSVRLRQMRDNSNEFTVPCHNEQISALRLSHDGRYLVTACEGGQYVRVFGWFETDEGNGTMQPPMSLYMIEVQGRVGLINGFQLSKNMNYIAVSMERSESQRAQNYESGFVNSSIEPKKSTIQVYGVNHRDEEAKGKVRNQQME